MAKKRVNRKRSLAAKKGWATRRAVAAKRSRAAKKGWKVRKAKAKFAVAAPTPLAPILEPGRTLEYTVTTAGGTPQRKGTSRHGAAVLALKVYGVVQYAIEEREAVTLFRRLVEHGGADARLGLDAVDWRKGGKGGSYSGTQLAWAMKAFRRAITHRRAITRIGLVAE